MKGNVCVQVMTQLHQRYDILDIPNENKRKQKKQQQGPLKFWQSVYQTCQQQHHHVHRCLMRRSSAVVSNAKRCIMKRIVDNFLPITNLIG